MTSLLEDAIRRIQTLSAAEQDAVAAEIIENLDDEAQWSGRFRNTTPLLALAEEAADEHRRGETRPLDELIE